MRCPVCRSPDTRVLDKRDSADASTTRRRRQCGKCLHRFTTYERPDTSSLMVVKSDQRRQEWNPDKLRRSLQVACTKRPISAETIERTVEQIESELRGRDSAEVSSSVIGDLAMEKLRQTRIRESGSRVEPLTERERLLQVRGVGERTVELLTGAGYHTVEDLYKESDVDRMAIKTGLGLKKARQILICRSKRFTRQSSTASKTETCCARNAKRRTLELMQ